MTPETLALAVKREGKEIIIIGLDEKMQYFFDIHYTPEQALKFATFIIDKVNERPPEND